MNDRSDLNNECADIEFGYDPSPIQNQKFVIVLTIGAGLFLLLLPLVVAFVFDSSLYQIYIEGKGLHTSLFGVIFVVMSLFIRQREKEKTSGIQTIFDSNEEQTVIKIRCRECNALNDDAARFCDQCGNKL
ncbi:zinc ribbon domain-containing protein [bacterium]|nr:zinc ribbon domain-containing protein [bacterium]